MNERPHITGDTARTARALQQKIHDLNVRFQERRQSLQRMKPGRVKQLGRSYGLPDDLNTSEMIKYILQKEFPVR